MRPFDDSHFISLRQKPIANLEKTRELRLGYRQHALDPSSAYFGEPLVDLLALGLLGKNYYHRVDNPPYHESVKGSIAGLYARHTVAQKLLTIDKQLQNWGLRLFLHDAYRPLAVQQYFHDEWMPARVKKANPHFSQEQVMAETEKYWAAPSESEYSPSPHASGGAIDLTLVFHDGGDRFCDAPFMGSVFDDFCDLSHTDYFEQNAPRYNSTSDEEARANRRILYWTMLEHGFANHPNEWWHYSWGDQMWARLQGKEKGVYGLARFEEKR